MSAQETISEAAGLKAWLVQQGEDDPELIRDMLEGETDIFQLREWAIRRYLDDLAFAEAVKERKANLAERQVAAERRVEKMRWLIQECMSLIGEKSFRGTDATVSMRTVLPKPFVSDETLVPAAYKKAVIDKSAINEAIKGGAEIPGVSLDNGGITMTIRSK